MAISRKLLSIQMLIFGEKTIEPWSFFPLIFRDLQIQSRSFETDKRKYFYIFIFLGEDGLKSQWWNTFRENKRFLCYNHLRRSRSHKESSVKYRRQRLLKLLYFFTHGHQIQTKINPSYQHQNTLLVNDLHPRSRSKLLQIKIVIGYCPIYQSWALSGFI